MKVPRFRLTWLMALVAVAALNLAALRWLCMYALAAPQDETVQVSFVGVWPMTNASAAALLLALRRPRRRPFWLGFAAAGAAAALFVLSMLLLRREVVYPYLDLFFRPFWEVADGDRPGVLPIAIALGTVVLGLPQLAIALVVGFIVQKFMHRPAPDTPGTPP